MSGERGPELWGKCGGARQDPGRDGPPAWKYFSNLGETWLFLMYRNLEELFRCGESE